MVAVFRPATREALSCFFAAKDDVQPKHAQLSAKAVWRNRMSMVPCWGGPVNGGQGEEGRGRVAQLCVAWALPHQSACKSARISVN